MPTISINKTEGCHIYLSEESLECEIVSAKSSEMNILVPQDGDYVSAVFLNCLIKRMKCIQNHGSQIELCFEKKLFG